MRIKDFTDTIRHLTDPFNIPEARRMIQENPALTQEQFKVGGRVGYYEGKLVKTGPEKGLWAVQFPEETKYFKNETLANKGIKEYQAQPRKESKARIPFTKKEQKVAEALAKKKGILVKDLDGQDRKYIRDKFYTLENVRS